MASSSATRATGWCLFSFSLMNPAHFPGQISDTPVATLLHRSWPSWLPSMFFCLCHRQAHRQAPWIWLLKQLLLPHLLTRNLLILLHNNSFGIKFLLERSFFFFFFRQCHSTRPNETEIWRFLMLSCLGFCRVLLS